VSTLTNRIDTEEAEQRSPGQGHPTDVPRSWAVQGHRRDLVGIGLTKDVERTDIEHSETLARSGASPSLVFPCLHWNCVYGIAVLLARRQWMSSLILITIGLGFTALIRPQILVVGFGHRHLSLADGSRQRTSTTSGPPHSLNGKSIPDGALSRCTTS
jgi:hypothetical protein